MNYGRDEETGGAGVLVRRTEEGRVGRHFGEAVKTIIITKTTGRLSGKDGPQPQHT